VAREKKVPDEFPDQEINAALGDNSAFRSHLENREYDQLEHLLKKEGPETEDSPITSNMVVVARQICRMCADCQKQAELHQNFYKKNLTREKALQRNLEKILNFLEVSKDQLVNLSSSEFGLDQNLPGEATAQPSFWQRTKKLLGFEFILNELQDESKVTDETIESGKSEQPLDQTVPASTGHKDIAQTLTIYCFSHFRVYVDDIPIDNWMGNISKSMFKYMVLNREQPIPTEVLMDTFWPAAEPESARRNLYQAIYQIRQAFQSSNLDIPIILSSNGSYGINLNISIWLDCEEFMRQYEHGRQLFQDGLVIEGTVAYETADSLHDGEFLAEELYDDWTFQEREHFRRVHSEILNELTSMYYEQERWAICVSYGQRLLSQDISNEEAHRLLMKAYFRQGQRHLALKQYYRCVEVLQQELDTKPMPETIKLYHQIRQS
jgi:DNA-binding SARP family transcriptional activator